MDVLTTLLELIDATDEQKYIENNQLFSILVRVIDGILWYRVVYDGWTPDPYEDYGFGSDSEEYCPDLGFTYFDVDMFGNVSYNTADGNYLKASIYYEQMGWFGFHSD